MFCETQNIQSVTADGPVEIKRSLTDVFVWSGHDPVGYQQGWVAYPQLYSLEKK